MIVELHDDTPAGPGEPHGPAGPTHCGNIRVDYEYQADETMTSEEYLRTSEWQTDCPYGLTRWFKRNAAGLYSRGPFERIEEAIEVQLAEDRARYNFVRERSEMHGGMLVPRC